MQTIPSLDLYRELEVDPAASVETIEAAWKSLLKRHHPDVAADQTAAVERVKRLNLAHEWLTDPRRRAIYDRSRRRPGVVVMPRSDRPADTRRAGREPRTVSRTSAGKARAASPDGAPGPTERPSNARAGTADARWADGHNPYAEYDAPRARPPASPEPGEAPPRRPAAGQPRIVNLLAPLALASVLIIVAASQLFGGRSTPAVVAESTSAPDAAATGGAVAPGGGASPTLSTQIGALASGAENPRGLPPADVAATLPTSCAKPDLKASLSFEATVGSAPAEIFFVHCDTTHTFGPVVFVAGSSAWELRARGAMRDGTAQAGFSGPLSGRSPDEFGVAWARSGGTDSTVTLYRIDGTAASAYWDSSSIGLQWSLATFHWRAADDPNVPGELVVVAADLNTGTKGCATCHDHQLSRETYAWTQVLGVSQLRQIASEDAGIGPP